MGAKVATTCDINGQKAKISYPCKWEYKFIILKEDDANEVIMDVNLPSRYDISPSNTSKSGKYQSYNLSITVDNEKQREDIFLSLKQNKKIKYVL